MKVSWIGMPTLKNARKMVEAWLERKPVDVIIVRGINPACDLMLAFGLDSLRASGMELLIRESFRRHSVFVVDNYLNAKEHWSRKHAEWFVKMVRMLFFYSPAEMELFGKLYPNVKTGRMVLPMVAAPESERPRQKRRKRKKKISVRTLGENEVIPGRDDGSYGEIVPAELEEKVEFSPQKAYEKELDKSAKAFWGMVRRLAKSR